MKYVSSFQEFIIESLGISKDVEEQAREIFKEISQSNDKNFAFVYYTNDVKTFFNLKIEKIEHGVSGRFTYNLINNNLKITLKDRKDFATLLHELKHMDYHIKTKGKYHNNIISKSSRLTSQISKRDPIHIAWEIFYVYDTNEFESQYHSYYVDIDEYLSKNREKINTPFGVTITDRFDIKKRQEIKKQYIIHLITEYLDKHEQKVFTWWVTKFAGKEYGTSDKIFRFSDYFKQSEINKLLFIINRDGRFDNDYSMMGTIKEMFFDIKNKFKKKFNVYSKEDKIKIEKTKNKLEKEINRRKKIFGKKFYRIFSIMVDKYGK